MRLPLLCAAVLAVVPAIAQDPIVPDRKVELFDGKSLGGWYTWLRDSRYEDPKRVFSITDAGELRISGEEWGGITTRQAYRDYHLVVEWRWGTKTWGNRETRARDSGILVHAVGEDGAAGGTWMESLESQIIEGGSGDLILVAGKSRPRITAKVRELGKEIYWDRNGAAATRESGRINWWGRSPEWKDQLGFRGPKDIEKEPGGWNRQEVIADGGRLTFVLNGEVVNHAYDCSLNGGKIQIQSEGAEILIRKVEIEPVRAARPPVF